MNMGKNGMLNPDTSILTVKNNSKNYQLISARHKAYLLRSVIGMPVQQKYETIDSQLNYRPLVTEL